MVTCPTCGRPLIQKPRGRLIAVGCLMIVIACGAGMVLPLWFAPLAILPLLIAAYLFVWAISGKGLWCRNCKKFPHC